MAAVLAILLIVGIAYLWSRATERTAFGAVPTAVIALLLLLSPHTSLQWVMWYFPFAAISRDVRTGVWACVSGASATAVYVAASVTGGSPFATAAEFVRIIAIAATLVSAVLVTRLGARMSKAEPVGPTDQVRPAML